MHSSLYGVLLLLLLSLSVTAVYSADEELDMDAGAVWSRQYHEYIQGLEGMITLENGISYKVLENEEPGLTVEGPYLTVNDVFAGHYQIQCVSPPYSDDEPIVIALINTWEREKLGLLRVDGEIKGLKEVLPLMRKGDKFMIYFPYQQAFGVEGHEHFPPYSTAVVVVQVYAIQTEENTQWADGIDPSVGEAAVQRAAEEAAAKAKAAEKEQKEL
eukprot:TRINITY_DN2540_c0_g2_i1.p1 TRINITY_DN2540_c0_g2~~TRINITY_DN2540_c0_g2_i1.p1  ORF type:complete len:215 (+),score=78.46 TRINITY_DN2540_c0_g2_i1:92-736(+)